MSQAGSKEQTRLYCMVIFVNVLMLWFYEVISSYFIVCDILFTVHSLYMYIFTLMFSGCNTCIFNICIINWNKMSLFLIYFRTSSTAPCPWTSCTWAGRCLVTATPALPSLASISVVAALIQVTFFTCTFPWHVKPVGLLYVLISNGSSWQVQPFSRLVLQTIFLLMSMDPLVSGYLSVNSALIL